MRNLDYMWGAINGVCLGLIIASAFVPHTGGKDVWLRTVALGLFFVAGFIRFVILRPKDQSKDGGSDKRNV